MRAWGTRESEAMMAVLGERRGSEFVPGRTIAIYFYLEQSKEKQDSKGMKKFKFWPVGFEQVVCADLNEHTRDGQPTHPASPLGEAPAAPGRNYRLAARPPRNNRHLL